MVKVEDIVKREKVFGSGSYEFNVPSILKATRLMTELNNHYGVKSEIIQEKKEVPKNFIGKVAILNINSINNKLKLKYDVKSKKLKVVL
jgi:hypothetical protein